MSREMVDSGIPWIGEIPKDWKLHRFKYAGTLQKGKLPSETNIDGNGQPIIGASEMLGKPFRQFSMDKGLPECSANDILILWDGANAGIVASGLCGIVSSTAAKYSCVDSRCNPQYTFYLLKGVESYFRDKVFGTTIPHMNDEYINDVPLLLPSLSEQQMIAEFLDRKCAEVDEMIALQEQIIEELKAYKRAVITEAVTKGVEPNITTTDSGVEWIGEIPAHWSISKLKPLTTLITDGTHQTPTYIEKGIPFLSIKDISSGVIDFSDTKYISEEDHIELSKHAPIQKGDIIFTRIGTMGVFVKVDTNQVFDIFVSVGLIKLKEDAINKDYFVYYMSSNVVLNYITQVKAGGGTSAAKFNLGDVAKTYVLLPQADEQKEIVVYLNKKCDEIDSLINIKLSKINSLKEYKKSIIYEYVTGKREVE